VIQQLDFGAGPVVVDRNRITLDRPRFSVLANVPREISKNVDPGMGKGTSNFGRRTCPENGVRPKKVLNSRNDFSPGFQVANKYGVSLGVAF
jgi:hypothetical protein